MNKWFIIENHLDKKEALSEARIPFTELQIKTPKNITGIAFPGQDLGAVRLIIGLPELNEVATDLEGVFFLKETVKPFGVVGVTVEDGSDLEHWSIIEPVLQNYAKLLNLEIVVSNPHGYRSDPITKEGKLYIRFWSSSMGEHVRREYAFGKQLSSGQPDGIHPSGDGILISDDDGNAVAEIQGGTLYILFDLPHGLNAPYFMEEIMKRYILAIGMDTAKLNISKEAMAKRENVRNKDAYVKACLKRFENIVAETKSRIETAEASLQQFSEQIVSLTRQLADLYTKAKYTIKSEREFKEKLYKEYNKLIKTPGVRNVSVAGGIVSIFTDTIFFEYNKNKYELGDYRIDIGTPGGLRIINTRVRELTNGTYYHHPHIFGDGDGARNVCLGNIQEGILRLIGQYEYAVVAQILIDFLKTVNTKGGDKGQYIGYLLNEWKPMEDDAEKVEDTKNVVKDDDDDENYQDEDNMMEEAA